MNIINEEKLSSAKRSARISLLFVLNNAYNKTGSFIAIEYETILIFPEKPLKMFDLANSLPLIKKIVNSCA